MIVKRIILLLMFTIQGSLAEDRDQSAFLDNMFRDIIQTMPKTERHIVDSVLKRPVDKTTINPTNNILPDSTINAESGTFSYEQNEKLKKIIDQVNINRDKRIIHFMSTDQETETK
jgi:hypothetical protein